VIPSSQLHRPNTESEKMKKLTQTTLLCLAICATSLCSGQNADFIRGDCNQDGSTDFVMGDVVALSALLFSGGSCGIFCADACDANDDGAVNVSDLTFMVANGLGCSPPYLAAPWPNCGPDPTADGVGCISYNCAPPPLPINSTYIFSSSSATGSVGSTVTVDVSLTIPPGETVSAWTFGLCHDASMLQLNTVTPISPLIPNPVAQFPDGFFYEDGDFGGGGSLTGPGPHLVATVEYTILAPAPTAPNFCNSIGTCTKPIAVFSPTVPVLPCTIQPHTISGLIITPPNFIRSDTNRDSLCNIADAVNLLSYLFPGSSTGTCSCRDACDVNDDGMVDIGDAIYKLAFLFNGGPPPPSPYPTCGPDPTPDSLDCLSFPPCP
jgi:hypothetical protein